MKMKNEHPYNFSLSLGSTTIQAQSSCHINIQPPDQFVPGHLQLSPVVDPSCFNISDLKVGRCSQFALNNPPIPLNEFLERQSDILKPIRDKASHTTFITVCLQNISNHDAVFAGTLSGDAPTILSFESVERRLASLSREQQQSLLDLLTSLLHQSST